MALLRMRWESDHLNSMSSLQQWLHLWVLDTRRLAKCFDYIWLFFFFFFRFYAGVLMYPGWDTMESSIQCQLGLSHFHSEYESYFAVFKGTLYLISKPAPQGEHPCSSHLTEGGSGTCRERGPADRAAPEKCRLTILALTLGALLPLPSF